jgi:hypothetical protein
MTTAMIVTLAASGGCKKPDGEDGPVTGSFSDPQAVGLAVVLLDHQATVGTAAINRPLTFPQVQEYATRVVAETSAARDHLMEVAANLGVMVDQTTTEAKTNEHDTEVDVGNHQDDGTYLGDSVHDISKAVRIWDNTILPNVSVPMLKDELQSIRAMLAALVDAGTQVEVETGIPPKP